MNESSMESFIQWCDDVTIAEEGLKDILIDVKNIPAKIKEKASFDIKKHKKIINLSNAPITNNVNDTMKLVVDNAPVIEVSEKLAEKIMKRKTSSIVNTVECIGLDALSIVGLFVYPDLWAIFWATLLAGEVSIYMNSTNNKNLTRYRSYKGTNGKYYLIDKDYIGRVNKADNNKD